MSTVVFLGPSIPKTRVPSVEGVEVRLPVRQGDVLRALEEGATRIGIIDGYFDQVPSVWHKEILFAIEQGVVVYGAASMGALRAAELHTFGMIGVGRVFEMFRDGVLEDDDEVALLHGSADDGYRNISEAMVNLRDIVGAAIDEGVVAKGDGEDALSKLKALPYPARSVRRLVELLPGVADLAKRPRLKERDALALFARLADRDVPRGEPVRTERTVFFERLRLEVRAGRSSGAKDVRRREALLAMLAPDHAAALGMSPRHDDLGVVVREIMSTHGVDLADDGAVAAFLEAHGLDEDTFLARAREEASIRRLELHYERDLDARAQGTNAAHGIVSARKE